MLFEELFAGAPRPVAIAVIHLPPLPGSPGFRGSVDELVEYAVRDAQRIEEAGFDAVIIENYGDAPFLKRVEDPAAIAAMSLAVREVVKLLSIPVGVNMLRNSAVEAYAIAYATGARFIRVNAFVETLVTDSGVVEPAAPYLARYRARYPGVAVFADVMCKHAYPLPGTQPGYAEQVVLDAFERGGADAVIVTGSRTGRAPDPDLVKEVRRAAGARPVLLGSGATPENVGLYAPLVDGVIVGSYIKKRGVAGRETEHARARRFIEALRRVSRS